MLGNKKGFRAFWQVSLRSAESVNHGLLEIIILRNRELRGFPFFFLCFIFRRKRHLWNSKVSVYFLQVAIVNIDYFLLSTAIRPCLNEKVDY